MNGSRNPLAEFLRDRRESLDPESVGLPVEPGRRVRGLRRSEVAHLAGISADYYLRLEQGRGHQPSQQVLSALSRALRLDHYGDEYLRRMAALAAGHAEPPVSGDLPSGALDLLRLHRDTPAYVSNATMDVVAVNRPGLMLAPGGLHPGMNLVLSVFAHYPDPHSEVHWERTARALVASLRYHADPRDARLRRIVAELSRTDERFRRIWGECGVGPQFNAWPMVHIDTHGWVTLRAESLALAGTGGWTITLFFAEPQTPGVAALADLVRAANSAPSDGSAPEAVVVASELDPITVADDADAEEIAS
ncbi:helix-turn-helix domain protein [Microbacterium laevaniformans OR221]|nr:helix-turn-helix domain protein [Microbacterium laevaniformans OR221]